MHSQYHCTIVESFCDQFRCIIYLHCSITFNTMARLCNAPKNKLLRDLPDKYKIKLAIQWLYENLDESPTTAARCYNIKKEKTLIKAWQREKKRVKNGRPQWGGQNKILHPEQHNAIIQYAVLQAI